MKAFEPKAVPPDSWRGWAAQALDLSTAQWLLNTVLVLAILGGVQLLPQQAGRLLLAGLAPGLLALFAAVASCAHSRRRPHQVLHGSLPGLARVSLCAVALLAALYAVVAAIAGALTLGGVGAPVPGAEAAAAPAVVAGGLGASDFAAGQSALLVLFLWLLVPLLFFLLPLLVCAQMPVATALALARQAQQLNPFAWRVSAAAGLLCLVGALWTGVAAVPFYPVIGSLLYVAYRHVFLGMPPESVRQASRAPWFAVQARTLTSRRCHAARA